jgi:protein O-GlcNAc transferase
MSIATLLKSFEKARKANDRPAAAEYLQSALERSRSTGEGVPRTSWYDLAALLFGLGRLEEAERWARDGLARQPKDAHLSNLLGVVLRNQGRLEEARAVLEKALGLDPTLQAARVNLGNVLLGLHDGRAAIAVYGPLVKAEPDNVEYRRMLGVSHRHAGELERALELFEQVRERLPNDPNIRIDVTAILEDLGRHDEAVATCEQAMADLGRNRALMETRIKLYRRAGQHDKAIAWLEELAAAEDAEPWMLLELARTVSHTDRPRANELYRRAHDLAPDDTVIMTAWADNLDRTRGPGEADNIAAAYAMARKRLALGGDLRRDSRILRNIFVRAADYAALDQFGTFEDLGRYFAVTGQEAALHYMMSQARTPQHRRDLVEFHKLWGDKLLGVVQKTPVTRGPAIVGRAKIRVGIMSSDLRNHPVSYFAAPLLLNYDRKAFEFYCYSWCTQPADPIETRMAASVDAFRKHGSISSRAAAQLIADDDLDIFFDLGGSTDMNKIDVMAYRPAPRQASWLGYPHSAGLTTIDRILVDPFIRPDDPALLIEKPFNLTRSWVALNKPGFGAIPEIDPLTPQERTGKVTFGTMNGTYKYNAGLFGTWAEVLKRVPGSEFLFVRPESAVSSFRDNVARIFEAHGVAAERIRHIGIRGLHMPHYNDIDVALDTFPQTGGTTTCETLWMGVPCVTLVGEAFFERLSYSNLENAGLGELCAVDKEAYIAKAVEVAGRTAWRTELRRTMRQRLVQYPLGRPDLFIEDFQDSLREWMDEPRP